MSIVGDVNNSSGAMLLGGGVVLVVVMVVVVVVVIVVAAAVAVVASSKVHIHVLISNEKACDSASSTSRNQNRAVTILIWPDSLNPEHSSPKPKTPRPPKPKPQDLLCFVWSFGLLVEHGSRVTAFS